MRTGSLQLKMGRVKKIAQRAEKKVRMAGAAGDATEELAEHR
jgi:hypothetical protein